MSQRTNRLKHNILKHAILSLIFHNHLCAYDVATQTYNSYSNGVSFQDHYRNISITLQRLAKKYDPTKSPSRRGYTHPYATRRISRTVNNRNVKKHIWEYKATKKGRRMVCEWAYRLQLGHLDLKWRGGFFNPLIKTCGGDCGDCQDRPTLPNLPYLRGGAASHTR